MRVCPRLVDLHDRAFVFICREYDLGERRAVKVQEAPSDEPQPVSVWFPLGDPQAHLGVLDFYMAVPRPLQLVPAPEWLTGRAPALR